jgi:hypothetical protein
MFLFFAKVLQSEPTPLNAKVGKTERIAENRTALPPFTKRTWSPATPHMDHLFLFESCQIKRSNNNFFNYTTLSNEVI